MRAIVLGMVFLTTGCGKTESAPSASASATPAAAAASAAAPAARSVPLPRIGGSVVAVGDHAVEVRLHAQGRAEAVVTDAAGKLVEGADTSLSLRARAEGGKEQEIALTWQPAELRFSGSADAALAPSPVAVELRVGGKTATATLAATALLSGPNHGGTLLATSGFGAEIVAHTNGEVQAFVHNRSGAAVGGDVATKFSAVCQGKGDAKHEIALAFDAPSASFKGRVAAGAELAPGPIELHATTGGAVDLGRLEKLCLFGAARHGGTLVAAGDYGVELVVGADGAVRAYVTDPFGRAHVDGKLALELALGVDAGQRIALRWNAPEACYAGKLAGRIDLRAEPVQVGVTAGARVAWGALHAAKLQAKARLAGSARATAKLDAELTAPKVDVDQRANLDARAKVAAKVPQPKVAVAVDKSASAGAKAGTGAKASAKAGISFGLK